MKPEIAILSDYVEEGWTSMDYCEQMLVCQFNEGGLVRPVRVRPPFRRRVQRLPMPIRFGQRIAFNADRIFNRFWDYPRAARRLGGKFDFFHVCDHSYSQLVHELPRERTGVYCHDLDTFRSLLEPRAEPRPLWFRSMMRRVLDGLSRAAIVFCATETIHRQIVDSGIVDPERLVLAPYGFADEFQPEPGEADEHLPLPIDRDQPFLLHVGSTIPRKRIDVLLDTFARVRARVPDLRLVQVGGSWTDEQKQRIVRLGLETSLDQLRGLERSTLAALYRRSAAVLLPSEAEGFGLPLVEAIASGAIVIASDLPVLREVGGASAIYRPVGDLAQWSSTVIDLIEGRLAPLPLKARLARVSRYSWANQAKIIAEAYVGLAELRSATRSEPSPDTQPGHSPVAG